MYEIEWDVQRLEIAVNDRYLRGQILIVLAVERERSFWLRFIDKLVVD